MNAVNAVRQAAPADHFFGEGAQQRELVCIQGLGFVGAAMAAAVASARGPDGAPRYNVVGVDLPNKGGRERIAAINEGRFPFPTNDLKLTAAVEQAARQGNLVATDDEAAYGAASIILIDVNFDIDRSGGEARFAVEPFKRALGAIARHMRPDALLIVETTVPPGTCAKVVAPEVARILAERGLPTDQFLLAHAYERVMPGDAYFDSIVNFWRVYSGHSEAAADACEAFLASIVNVEQFPLRRLGSTTASETAKVLENSYRAVTIALMEEWGRFAEVAGVDLFEVISAIRVRPTHSNIRTPGLGVGGYCLTKDPLFAAVAARDLFEQDVDFSFSTRAVEVNDRMPARSVQRLKEVLGGSLVDKQVLLLGLAYRPDVGDTRHSASFVFRDAAEAEGARLILQDPLVRSGGDFDGEVLNDMPAPDGIDAIVFAVDHRDYREFDFVAWLDGRTPTIFDANGVLDKERRGQFRRAGCVVASLGRGDDL
jgi:nucleotide sugar dehydrogenase